MNRNKWQHMLLLVNQNAKLLQPGLKQQYKTLFLKRLLMNNFLVFLIQFIGLKLNLDALLKSPLWFFTGSACAFIFLQGYRVFPGIWLGNFIAFYLAKTGFMLAFGCATIVSLLAALVFWFGQHYGVPTLIFYRLNSYLKFILFTVALTAIASILLVFICHLSIPTINLSLQLWLQWWLGNLIAILIFSCAIISWDAYFPDFFSIKQLNNKLLLSTLYLLLILDVFALALSATPSMTIFLALSNFFITLAISILFGWCGAISAVFLSSVMLNLAAILDAAVFSTPFVTLTSPFLQLLLGIEIIIGVVYSIQSQQA